MHKNTSIIDQYQRLYITLGFDRSDLFKLLQKTYQPQEVLYPGCSLHLTPAFFFPHIVFVDKDPETAAFFSNDTAIFDFVNQRRTYQRTPYIQFIEQDFALPLPTRANQFDLILALYAAGISKGCWSYLKIGGLLISNNHQNDAAEAMQNPCLNLVALIQKRQHRYQFMNGEPHTISRKHRKNRANSNLRSSNAGYEYVDQEIYYVFKRIS